MTIYIISEFDRKQAIRHTGGTHHKTIAAAVKKFAHDAIAVEYTPGNYLASDILKVRSSGQTHLSKSAIQMIEEAK